MFAEVLKEEIEVLESIYPTELLRPSGRDIEIIAEPDDPLDGAEELRVALCLHYTDAYPDELPEMSLKVNQGSIDDTDLDGLVSQLREAGEENLGMAMTFTLVTLLREKLSQLIRVKVEKQKMEEMEKERRLLEEEEARTRGTPVTVESFKVWKAKFDKKLAAKKVQEEEEKLKAMTPKEREEYKRLTSRLSGRHLFERNKHLEDESLMEEGTVSVDVSQYDRSRDQEDTEENIVTFSDSE
ncbi:ubiquitin-conjugating enzyme/RWD-like protein [Amanita rubescens]|nr:ubiquitin-conjugating enzyme/RWD-like protein [Amanita rubescens]